MKPSGSTKEIFSKDESLYKAICFFDIDFDFQAFKESFGVHVPVVLEDDGLYYALCIELNQVTYGSTISNALDRMSSLLEDLVDMSITGESDWAVLWEKSMDQDYNHIFHNLKRKFNKDKAKKLSIYLKDRNSIEVKTFATKDIIHSIKSSLGEVKISQRYFELVA